MEDKAYASVVDDKTGFAQTWEKNKSTNGDLRKVSFPALFFVLCLVSIFFVLSFFGLLLFVEWVLIQIHLGRFKQIYGGAMRLQAQRFAWQARNECQILTTCDVPKIANVRRKTNTTFSKTASV